jgi:NAD(P)-dependent dehydrogenase (short-subunit alcohol dehydrogenase family)
MPRALRGASVVITGASSGIGRASALAFAREGARLTLASRTLDALRDVAGRCERLGASAIPVETDVTVEASVRRLAEEAVRAYGAIDVWVNAAAVLAMGRVEETPSDVFRRVIETNLMGYVNGAWAVLPVFREQRAGVLVNVASLDGKIAVPYAAAYTASKHAVVGFSHALRQELRLDGLSGVHVCVVNPTTIDTPLFQHAANFTGARVRALPPVYPPERVARRIVRLARRPRREVYVGGAAHAMSFLWSASPRLAEAFLARFVDRGQLDRGAPRSATSGNAFGPEAPAAVAGGWKPRGMARMGRGIAIATPVLAAAIGVAWAARRG